MKRLMFLAAATLVVGSTAFACPDFDGFGVVEPVQSQASDGAVYECYTISNTGIAGEAARNKCGLWARDEAVKNCNAMYTVAGKCNLNTHCSEVPDNGQ